MRKPNTTKAAPEAADLRQRAARARDAAGRFDRRTGPVQAAEVANDPALAVTTVFRASWDGLNHALEAEGPGELVADLEGALGAAYDRLRAVRPTTPAGFRALAECWAIVLKGHRGGEPGEMASDHAADSLIAGAGACVPAQVVDWYAPPPGFMASPAIEPFNFARIPDGIAIELERLRGIAMAEFNRRVGPETSAGDIARISLELRLDVLANAAHLDDSIPGQLDVASASLLELQAIREKMALLSDVAYGMAAQDCCKLDRGDPAASRYNAAGALMHWLADEFTTVEDRAGAELQRRRPTEFWDRRTRLAAVAERVILNGDDAETATLIQDLMAFAAEQAEH
ncbi:hypothetical protein SAMN02799636_04282 [Methylobacterium sp. 275MFSha3.1]|uniref:hypothetical protein n=1 Tax=Methylobacterium sp. 275MFSha3.1 TaxID=1502746 RepID=UPI0008A811DC|nr:hypothetical protein [Methylobacterium sp. 275MFSha3.1]SEH88593.1 hypothetical protein SAMN02799636_04282 [Methylobacterium sp. 275MFSha3.1]